MKTRRTCYDSEGEKRALKKRVEKCSSVCSSAVIPKFRVGSGWVWTAYSGIVVKTCGRIKGVKGGGMVNGLVLKFGFGLDLFVLSSLVSMYAKFGDVGSARRVFDWMGEKERDVVTWNALLDGFKDGLCNLLLSLYSVCGEKVTAVRSKDRSMSNFEHREIGPLAQQSSSSPRAQNSKLEREIEERVRLQVTELEEMDYLNMEHMAFSQHFFSESSSVALAFLGMVTWEAKRDFILKAYKFDQYKEEYKEEMRMMMSYRRE
ncbi:pentatricopeptide repeat-containing protein [Tanacetum coccineum]|uniref:Pentatricopeptide repeat-containing protein n=1 Tax=Tanacetum coccineum TaxID=301880 RepID=A0ABQ5G6W9_9ASTR